jgi:hypothetical protein
LLLENPCPIISPDAWRYIVGYLCIYICISRIGKTITQKKVSKKRFDRYLSRMLRFWGLRDFST